MPKVSRALLKEAFIQPIRFALLLDDSFPTFQRLAAEDFNPLLDNKRAKDLFDMCRKRGWLCDVSNRPGVATKFENDNHLHQSDLLILDYNLDPKDNDDPTDALRLIQRLAASDHFNLVIVYTGSDALSVTRDIAFSLGAGSELDADRALAARQMIENIDPEESDDIENGFSNALTDAYLRNAAFGKSAATIRGQLAHAGIAPAQQGDVITEWVRARLTRKIKPEILASRSLGGSVSLGLSDDVYWVTRDNVFVAVVNKIDHSPDELIDMLEDAITDWDPNPLMVMMMHARSALEKAGTLSDHKVLETPRQRAGWLLRVLLGKTEAQRKEGVADLYGRLFNRLAASIEPSIVDFGARLVRSGAGEDPVDLARTLADAQSGMTSNEIYHALNEHLCAGVCTDTFVSTGVILAGKRGGQDAYWVCVTPACDLVEGQNKGGWDGELLPTRVVSVARLTPNKTPKAIQKALEEATVGRYLFLNIQNTPFALEVVENGSRQMSLETLFLGDAARIKNGKVTGYMIGAWKNGAPKSIKLELSVLAKLRPDYASRLLTQAGSQRARIGVDFVSIPATPEPEKTCATEAHLTSAEPQEKA